MKLPLLLLAALALPAAGADYYLIKNETATQDYCSLDGRGSDNSNFSGWATTPTGTTKVQYGGSYGAVDPTGVYHLNGHIVRGKPSSMDDYSFQGGELVFNGTNPALNDKMNNNSTLTIGSLRVVSGTHGEIRNGDNGFTKTLAGNWTIEAGGMFGLNMGDENKNTRSFICTATISGEGTFAATAGIGSTTSTGGSVTMTGDLSGFKGVLSAGEKGATYTGTHAAAVANRSLVIGAETAWPQSTPDGDVLLGSVVVTNGAKLAFACSVDSAEIRGWDFGTGAVPTVDVASGYTVRVFGPVQGTVGFKKTGAGTLVLDVGGEGAYEPITLTGQSTVSAATLSAYAARCEQWLEDRSGSATAGTIFFF